MSAISVRLPDSLHRRVREMAHRDNVSINQMITLAVAEKLSALETEDYLGKRARVGARRSSKRHSRRSAQRNQTDRTEYRAF